MNIYLTQLIFGLVEMPARTITLFTLNRSRKISQLAFLAVGGMACLLTIFVPSGTDTQLDNYLQGLPTVLWNCSCQVGNVLFVSFWLFLVLSCRAVSGQNDPGHDWEVRNHCLSVHYLHLLSRGFPHRCQVSRLSGAFPRWQVVWFSVFSESKPAKSRLKLSMLPRHQDFIK